MNAIERIGWALVEHSNISAGDFLLVFLFAFLLGFVHVLGRSVAEDIIRKRDSRQRNARRQAAMDRLGIR